MTDIQNKKSDIKSLVLDLRRTLEKEMAIVLKQYGLQTDHKWPLDEPPARIDTETEREIWQRIVAVVRRSMKEGRNLPQASQDYVREAAFTFLNRLVGLKCLEVRGLIDEVITTHDIYGGRSQFHRDYRDDHPREARAADDALPAALVEACRRVNEELIGYLFDPDDDHSLVWPRYAVLKSCIEKINTKLEDWVWVEDEIIGWIYQFYNAEEKIAVRKRGKPQTPHEVAVINQFFTPRWVVKFLVDNTLGRLWLEMHPDSPRVREKCDYLVPEVLPDVEGQESQGLHKRENTNEKIVNLDLFSPINNPQAPPRRDHKPINRIRLLDPACGTMHFGHYACEVFEAMYKDARDMGETPIEDWQIPGTILEFNLFGVDIDRRAVQLAALSLFMKARTMHAEAQVTQVNLVVADATLPNSKVKQTFLDHYARTPKVQKAFAQVLNDMDQVAQLGSLLRVDDRLRELLAQAGHSAGNELDPRLQAELPGLEPAARQLSLAEIAPEDQALGLTPHYTLQELRDDLRKFARAALQEHDVNAQLFATEADKAMRLLDVLMGEYDVVVMNPPYGFTMSRVQSQLKGEYESAGLNLFTAFIKRAFEMVDSQQGYVGAIVDRIFVVKKKYERFRADVLRQGRVVNILADLGWEILDDAYVRTAATVLHNKDSAYNAHFIRLEPMNNRASALSEWISDIRTGKVAENWFCKDGSSFKKFPNNSFAYWLPQSAVNCFTQLKKLEPAGCEVRQGLASGNNTKFYKWWWEVPFYEIGRGKDWIPLANGGGYSPYYRDNQQVVFWRDNGDEIRNLVDTRGKSLSRVQNEGYFFRPGLTYGRKSNLISVQLLNENYIFSNEGMGIFPFNSQDVWELLAYLNSRLAQYLLNSYSPLNKEVGYVKLLPYKQPNKNLQKYLRSCGKESHDFKAAWDTGNEICTRFTTPWLLQLADVESDAFETGLRQVVKQLGWQGLACPITLKALLAELEDIEQAADAKLQQLQAEIDEAVYDLYEISPADQQLIERELGNRPPELVWPQMEGKSKPEKRREHVRRLFSFFALQAVRQDDDGIVPLAGRAARGGYLVDRVRTLLEVQFGAKITYQLEQDAVEYLGRPLEEWLHRFFFHQFHVKLYKSRPILWHLTSPQGYFAVLLDYHRLTRDTLPRVKMLYLWPQIEDVSAALAHARNEGATTAAIADLEEEQADLEAFSQQLSQIIDNGYGPEIDDGVKVNLLPLQAEGLLPVSKVV